jgi:hypothetical protein
LQKFEQECENLIALCKKIDEVGLQKEWGVEFPQMWDVINILKENVAPLQDIKKLFPLNDPFEVQTLNLKLEKILVDIDHVLYSDNKFNCKNLSLKYLIFIAEIKTNNLVNNIKNE